MCGAGVNEYEGCGASPLLLAVIAENLDMVNLILEFGGRVSGAFPGSVISPLQCAEVIGNDTIFNRLKEVDERVTRLQEHLMNELMDGHNNQCEHELVQTDSSSNQAQPHILGGRKSVISIGDVKTTITTRGLKNRAPDEFGIFSGTPGDFHCIGYVMGCLAKIYGKGGLLYVVRQVLGRIKITSESFVSIFKDQNYERCFEAVTDFHWGLCIAAVIEFQLSKYFPSKDEIYEWENRHLNINNLLIGQFHEWLSNLSEEDQTVNYFVQFILHYGQLMQILQSSVRYGQGDVREACWMHLIPMFTALNNKNYRDETFVHITNIICK